MLYCQFMKIYSSNIQYSRLINLCRLGTCTSLSAISNIIQILNECTAKTFCSSGFSLLSCITQLLYHHIHPQRNKQPACESHTINPTVSSSISERWVSWDCMWTHMQTYVHQGPFTLFSWLLRLFRSAVYMIMSACCCLFLRDYSPNPSGHT